jgi:hypothetical protein
MPPPHIISRHYLITPTLRHYYAIAAGILITDAFIARFSHFQWLPPPPLMGFRLFSFFDVFSWLNIAIADADAIEARLFRRLAGHRKPRMSAIAADTLMPP